MYFYILKKSTSRIYKELLKLGLIIYRKKNRSFTNNGGGVVCVCFDNEKFIDRI